MTMGQDEALARAVGTAVGAFPKQIAAMLTRHAVVLDAPNLTIDGLVDAVYSGLHSSMGFNNDFTSFLAANASTLRELGKV